MNGNGWLTVYIVAPVLGALLGGGAYRFLLAEGVKDATSFAPIEKMGLRRRR